MNAGFRLRPMISVRQTRTLLLAGLVWWAAPHGTKADVITDVAGEVSIADLGIEPASKGAFAAVSFRLENAGSSRIRVARVETDLGERGAFDVHAGSVGSVHSDGFSLGPGEEVSFDGQSTRLLLGPLKRDLAEGDVVDVTFTFDMWSTTIPAHVHAPSTDGAAPVEGSPTAKTATAPRGRSSAAAVEIDHEHALADGNL